MGFSPIAFVLAGTIVGACRLAEFQTEFQTPNVT
jgi:hypothetical protein